MHFNRAIKIVRFQNSYDSKSSMVKRLVVRVIALKSIFATKEKAI